MLDTLKQLDFTDNEIKLYVWLLGNGEHTAAEAARNLSMDKSSAYRAAENLTQLGALYKSERIRGTTYEALNPEVLKDIYNQKKTQIIGIENSLDSLIKNLQSSSDSKKDTFIKVEHGYEAHIKIMELSLEDNPDKLIQEYWDLSNPLFSLSRYQRYLAEFNKKRLQKKIRIERLICNTNDDLTKSKYVTTKSLIEVKTTDNNFLHLNSFRLFGDYLEIISLDEQNNIIVTLLKSNLIITIYKNILFKLW